MNFQHLSQLSLLLVILLLAGCQPAVTAVAPASQPELAAPTATTPPTATALSILAAVVQEKTAVTQTAVAETPVPPPATPTLIPTALPPTATPTASATPTATPIGPCANRLPAYDDLLVVVTKSFGLSREYAPPDLVSVNDHLGNDVTLGYPTEVRSMVLEPLLQLIADMQAAGLQPQVLSGYRSYSAQSIAYNKWANEFPGHVNIISAPPGFSEHQLGTTIDFGSPELPLYTGDPSLQFHTYFYQTREGIWLLENAPKYGFTLSYPLETFELTGFYYEPWHYRYIGPEMALALQAQGISFIQSQLASQPEPCLPDEQ